MNAVENEDAVLQHAKVGGRYFMKLNLELYWLMLYMSYINATLIFWAGLDIYP